MTPGYLAPGTMARRMDGPPYLHPGESPTPFARAPDLSQPSGYAALIADRRPSAPPSAPTPALGPKAEEPGDNNARPKQSHARSPGQAEAPAADSAAAMDVDAAATSAPGKGRAGEGGNANQAAKAPPSGDAIAPQPPEHAIDANRPTLVRPPVQPAEPGASFRSVEPPNYRPGSPASTPEPPKPERDRAVALFHQTVSQAAQLHAALLALAQQATSSVGATEVELATTAGNDLDRSLATLRSGLDQAQQDLDRRADATDGFVDQRRQRTQLGITAAANAAVSALGGLKANADTTFKGYDDDRKAKGQDADQKQAEVVGAGIAAAAKVTGLDATKYAVYPLNTTPLRSATNEAIDLRLPERSTLRAKTYSDESAAQNAHLTATFAKMKSDLETQFTAITAAMNDTARGSATSIARSRDAARKQLNTVAGDMHRAVARARSSGHAALVGQHNSLRREMVASHRDRALRENTAAQQRAARGTAASLAAARAQQAGIAAMADALAREAGRPPDDLAKVIAASAGGLLRQIAKSGPEQRGRLDGSIKAGEDDARAQSRSLGGKLAGSAGTAGEQIRSASRSAADSLDTQTRLGTAPFDELAGQVTAALGSIYPTTRTAYLGLNEGTTDQLGAKTQIDNAAIGIAKAIAGDGDGKAALPGGAEGAGGPKEKPGAFMKRANGIAQKPVSDDGIDQLITTANTDIPARIDDKAGQLYDALAETSTKVERVMAPLRGLTKLQGLALCEVYREKRHGGDLAFHLRTELDKFFSDEYTNAQNIAAALAYLAGNSVEAANNELLATVYLWNDTGRAEKVMRALTPKQLEELGKAHPGTMAQVSSDLEAQEQAVFDALKKIRPLDNLNPADIKTQREENYKNLGIADANSLKRAMDQALEPAGEAGGDNAKETVTRATLSAGSDAIAGGDGAYEDRTAAEERRQAVWTNTETSFKAVGAKLPDGTPVGEDARPGVKPGDELSAIARYAAAKRSRTEFVPDEGPDGGHWDSVRKGLDPKQVRLLDDIVKTGPNSVETAASTIDFETNRKDSKPREDQLRKALLGDDQMAGSTNDKGEFVPGDPAKAKLRKAEILKKLAERQDEGNEPGAVKPVAPPSPEQVQKRLTDQLDARFAGDPTGAAYTKSMIESETFEPDAKKAFDFALAHDERNKETLQATTSRMSRDDVKKAVAQWDAGKPESERLYVRLGLYGHDGKLEGDARNETEIAFRGKPRNDKEKALIAIMAVRQQERDSGATGRALARGDYDQMIAQRAKVLGYLGVTADQLDETGDIKLDSRNGKEIRGRFDPETGQLKLGEDQRADFESAMRFSHIDAESYKQAVDRISQGIVMALIVAAAVITTFVTFGGAAAIWGPILITAAAGFAGMGMTALIRGDRYTSAEIQRDFVMTLVQAATAGLGAGLGAAAKGAGVAGKGAVTALDGVAAVEKGAETVGKVAGVTEELAAAGAGAAGKEGLSFGGKALQFGKDVVIGGGTNSINSFAGAAMDPENRRQGTALHKAVDGGIKGFLSGAFGAAVTKPFSALGRGFGPGGERIAGNVGSGYVTRLADARIGQAMGDPHQSWAESIEGAKDGIAQDAIRGLGEHHAEGLAEGIHDRRARAASPREAAGPATATPHAGEPSVGEPEAPAHGGAVAGAHPLAAGAAPEPVTAGPRRAGEEFPTARSPLTEEPGTLRRPGAEDEPRAKLRSVGRDEFDQAPITQREIPVIRRLADLLETTEPRPAPIFDHVDITPGMLVGKTSIPEHSEIRATNPKDPVASRGNYDAMRLADPNREVLLAHNPVTGEYMVIQGGAHAVEKPPAGWLTERHSHPRIVSEALAERLRVSLPSAVGGDFAVLRGEFDRLHGTVSSAMPLTHNSVIDINVNGVHTETHFSITRRGETYELSVSFHPAHDGIATLGPFPSIAAYAARATALTGANFANPGPGALRSAGAGAGENAPPSHVRRDAPLTAAAHADIAFVGESMARIDDLQAQAQGTRSRGELNPEPGIAAATVDAHRRVAAMGLVEQPDAMIRLRQILDDESVPLAMREHVAQATLAATRAAMIGNGTLAAGDDVMMLFRGVKANRLDDYQRGGIDLSRVDPRTAHSEDAGLGLYGSQDLESARNYAGKNDRFPAETAGGVGKVLPLIVRKSELGRVIDVRTGTPLGDRWLAYVHAHAGKMRLFPGYDHLEGVLKPGLKLPLAVERDGRGARYQDFLAELAQDPQVGATVRAAAADPHITLMDLGGVASTGNDRGILTDQWALHSQHIADMFNRAMGFPEPSRAGAGGPGQEPAILRSVVPATAAPNAAVPAPEPAPAAQITPAAPSPAPPPVTELTSRASARVTQAQEVLANSIKLADPARADVAAAKAHLAAAEAKLARAQGDYDAARTMAADPGGAALVKEERARLAVEKSRVKSAKAAVAMANGNLKPLGIDENIARAEHQGLIAAHGAIAAAEANIRALQAEQTKMLDAPPGGWTKEDRANERARNMIPRLGTPARGEFDALLTRIHAAMAERTELATVLGSSIKEMVDRPLPDTAPASALVNAASAHNDPLLRPEAVTGRPIDVTTGLPLTAKWQTDHIVARSVLMADPRFPRLSPANRVVLIHELGENFFPLSREANQSKGACSMRKWIANRARDGQPIPPNLVKPLLDLEQRAKAAIEEFYRKNLNI